MDASLSCVLFDVGGTLWPGQWAATEAVEQARVAGLYAALPELTPARGAELIRQLNACHRDCVRATEQTNPLSQVTHVAIRKAAQQLGLPTDTLTVETIRRALCPSPIGHL